MPSSVTSCTLNLEQELPGDFNLDRQRTYKLGFNIKTNGIIGPVGLYLGALTASPHPIYDVWQTYGTIATPVPILNEYDLDAHCLKVSTKKIDPKFYKAMCEFGTLPRGRDPGEATVNPLMRPVRYRGAKIVATRAVTKDIDGKPLVTSAKEEFDEAQEEEISFAVLVAVRNVASLDTWVSDMAAYINSVNSGSYRTTAARTWWCVDIEISDLIFESGISYYQETWQLALNLDKWNLEVLDRGWKILDDDGQQINAKDDEDKDLTAPVLLDGTGKKLGPDADPVARTFKIKREVSWGALPV